ncbi:MAG: hypothetical protein PHH06_00915 [Candidatus Gracilibacteria bacterium]|nr:hypothetical protein [Candidatus Gracilibacteria bacterium]
MAGKNTPKTPETGVEQTQKKPGSLSERVRLACETSTKAALLALSMTCATPAMADNQINKELLQESNTVHFVGGGTGELYEKGGKYYIKNGNSESGTDNIDAGIIVINDKVYLVRSIGADPTLVELSEFNSQIGIDYSKYGQEKVANLLAGEMEYLAAIEPIIQSKPEKIRDKIRGVFYRNWERALDEVNDGNGEMSGAYLRLLIEQTPNMVAGWEDFGGEYTQIYNNQQAKAEAQQAKAEAQQAKAELEKETKLYNALHGKK